MAINITNETVEVVQTLVRDAFDINSILDRVKTILATNLAFPISSNLVHMLAHKYPIEIADKLGDLIEEYNEPVNYGGIPVHTEEYETPQDAFNKVYDISIMYQNELNKAAKIAYDNMDIHVFEGIMSVISEHNKYVAQAIQWKDIADRYGDKPSLDKHMEDYDMLGLGD